MNFGRLCCTVICSLFCSLYHWLWKSNSWKWGDCPWAAHYHTVNSLIFYQYRQSGFAPSVPSSVCGEDESPDPTQVVCVMLPGTSIYRDYKEVNSYCHFLWTSATYIAEPKQYLLYASETLLVRHYIRMLLKCFVYSIPPQRWSYRFVLCYTQHCKNLNDHWGWKSAHQGVGSGMSLAILWCIYNSISLFLLTEKYIIFALLFQSVVGDPLPLTIAPLRRTKTHGGNWDSLQVQPRVCPSWEDVSSVWSRWEVEPWPCCYCVHR